MEALRQYVISVVAAAMLCGIVVRLFPNGSGKQVGKLICGLFLAYTVLSPISRVDFSKLPDFSLRYMDDAEDAAAMGENLARDSMADIIKEETEAYILDKAASTRTCALRSLSAKTISRRQSRSPGRRPLTPDGRYRP